MNGINKILILAPHTDDGEFGCGGAIARFIQEGKTVFYLAFSAAEKSVPKLFPRNILKKEVREATSILGILKEDLTVLSYPVRDFLSYRQEILEDIIRFKDDLDPDVVFLPCLNDTHQDHQVIAQEGFRAFKDITMLGYEVPWNNLVFHTSAFILLQKNHLLKKLEAMKCYKSQAHRGKVTEDFIRSLAKVRGTQVGHLYAESFELIRWVIR